MRTNDKKDLHTKTADELGKMLSELKLEVGKLKIDASLGKLKDLKAIQKKRNDIAIVMTILSSKKRLEK